MSECTHDCSTCGKDCSSRTQESLLKKPHEGSNIQKVIGVVSGKGGVGKSLVTAMMACAFNRRGYHTAILDADITGPSIPKLFGLQERIQGTQDTLYPVKTDTGIDVVSVNLLLDDERMPVVWRGPVIAGTVQQFWQNVLWENVDYMFVDMPPGTGDVPLTVFQSIPLDGIIVVTSPQELVSMIVAKAVNMANMMNIPILGVIENYSYFQCPDCGKTISIFGESHIDETAKEFDLDVLAKLPINPEFAKACDNGAIEGFDITYIEPAVDKLEEKTKS